MDLEKEINEFMKDPKRVEELQRVAFDAMEERIKQQFQWALPDTIAKECNDFITEHVAPEVRAHLIANKGSIIKAAKDAADEVGSKIAEAMVGKVTKSMDESWTRNKVIEALFK